MKACKGIPGFAVTVVAAGCAVAQLAACGPATGAATAGSGAAPRPGTSRPADGTSSPPPAVTPSPTPTAAGGSPSPPATGGGTGGSPGTGSPGGAAAPRRCTTASLRVGVSTSAGGAAAGTTYYPVQFTNISGQRCGLYGFPGVSFVTGPGGTQIGDPAVRSGSFGAVPVTLRPGGTAHAWLGVAAAQNYPKSTCQPVTAHWLRVYPPNDFGAKETRFTQIICSAHLHNSPQLVILPTRHGPGAPGQVP